MKAADINDIDVLGAVKTLTDEGGMWTNTSAVAREFPDAPFKVVAAKLRRLLKRGLLTGCDCGCRGDWELTRAGRERLLVPSGPSGKLPVAQ